MSQDERVPPFKEPGGEVGPLGDEEQPTMGGGWLAWGLLQRTRPLDDSDVCERLLGMVVKEAGCKAGIGGLEC